MTLAHTLWFTEARARFFLVPEGEELSDGVLAVRNLRNAHREVDAEQIGAFEVDRERAREVLRAQFGEAVDRFKGAFKALGAIAGATADTAEGLPKLRDWLGVGLEDLVTDPEHAGEAVREHLQAGEGREALREAGDKLQKLLASPELARTLDRFGDQLKDLGARLAEGASDPHNEEKP